MLSSKYIANNQNNFHTINITLKIFAILAFFIVV